MTPLERHLRAAIAAEGPIPVERYMAECLGHPEHGYYITRDPLGAAGDFVTAPEVSQMFGDLIGLWCADLWDRMGRPDPVLLVEMGPGRGTLMADALRAAAALPGFREAARLHLIETSPALRARQADALAGQTPVWHDGIETVPDGPLLLIANELLDALPIRQILRTEAGWRERMVTVEAGRLAFIPGDRAVEAPPGFGDAPPGSLVELRPAADALAATISTRLRRHGGAALFIDYGHLESAPGETLQAVRDHAYADVLTDPGEADLTAHVDFAAIAAHAAPARHSRLTPQGVFLERLGITARARKLASGLTGQALDAHVAAHRRLTHPSEMGDLFKVMAL
ncbi:MAG: SAM-dependent methyltransferase, partial [Proteobacteria bacterium]|nr:SAM-dependent methyltransferase [Pseudomonadota bacterium]